MIFVGLFALIALVVIGLNIYNSANLEKIESYLLQKQCSEVIYSKGSYKALCEESIIDIANSFSVDIEKDKRSYAYKEINTIRIEKLTIRLNNKETLGFKTKEELMRFYTPLEKKIKNEKLKVIK